MKLLRAIVEGPYEPNDINVLWIDTSLDGVSVLRKYANGFWTYVSSSGTTFIVNVDTLPEASKQTLGKMYATPSQNPHEGDTTDEWLTVISYDNDGNPVYSWEQIGQNPDLSQFITKSVNNLENYYLKTQTFTQEEIIQRINESKNLVYLVVDELPQASSETLNSIYLVEDSQQEDVYNMYITQYENSTYSWINIGNTSIALSQYATKDELNTKADRDTDAVVGNVAIFDANGNTIDGGISVEYISQLGQEVVVGTLAPDEVLTKKVLFKTGDLGTSTSEAAVVHKFVLKSLFGTFKASGRVASSSDNAMVCFYTKDDEFISAALVGNGTATSYTFETLALPSGTGIIRISGNTSSQAPVLVEDASIKNIVLSSSADIMDLQEDVTEIEAALSTKVDSSSLALAINYTEALSETKVALKTDGTYETGQTSNATIYTYYPTSVDGKFYFTGRVSSFSTRAMVCFYNGDGTFISSALPGSSSAKTYTEEEVTVPAGTAVIKVQGVSGTQLPALKQVLSKIDEIETTELTTEVFPELEYGSMSPTYGGFSEAQNAAGGSATTSGKKYMRTPRFIKVSGSTLSVKANIACQFRVFFYSTNFYYQFYNDWRSLTADTALSIQIPLASQYVKLCFRKDDGESSTLPVFIASLTGVFDSNFEVFNVRSADSGFQTIAVYVTPIDATASDEETNEVQDTGTPATDYGLLVLPPSYRNMGAPTRLIIYCHGAGVNYNQNTTRFPSSDCLPAYWLSEGYAVMDMDGEFYAENHQHTYLPEARQSYIAAYRWVIKNFNICRDGVFLGGRSMGGGMCFELLSGDDIPVIAACPVVPVCNTLWWWNEMQQAYRENTANKLGFTNQPEAWTGTRPMTQDEWDCLYANFDKMVRYSPLWRVIVDLPGKEELFDGMRIDPKATSGAAVEAEAALFAPLHARVKAPVKFFDNYVDPTVPYERNALIMYKMLKNAAQICELRMFDTSNDEDTSVTAHHFEMRTDRLTDIVNSRGETIENVPVVYIEMLRFWQRYEKVN